MKNSDNFHISAQNIDCGYSLEPPLRGGSNEYPQSMFLNRNKKNNVYPCKLQFYYKKWGLRGQNYIGMFSWCEAFGQTILNKQCRLRSDATERGVWSEATMFAIYQPM